MMITMEQVNVL